MDLAAAVRREIEAFVRESPANRHADGSGPYFDEPLVGFASAEDPLFAHYKDVIGSFHLTPRELFEDAFGEGCFPGGTVVSWILPIPEETRLTNRMEDEYPSARWAHTRAYGEKFNAELRRHVVSRLGELGFRAVAPLLSPRWKMLRETPVGPASTWSERHAAYAAGLGTFSLNDALITPRGIAHRTGSVVTDLLLPPSGRTCADYRANCLFFREQTCGACIDRCPVGALSEAGHDKDRCWQHVYGTVVQAVGERYGVTEAGCGLCQTGVPCESRIPRGRRAPT
jgi:epoxyqueuosine reductase QueG